MNSPTPREIAEKIVGTLLLAKAELEADPTVEKLHAFNLASAAATNAVERLAWLPERRIARMNLADHGFNECLAEIEQHRSVTDAG